MDKDIKLIDVFEDEYNKNILAMLSKETNISTIGDLENVSLSELKEYRNIRLEELHVIRYTKEYLGIYSNFDEILFRPNYEYIKHIFKNKGDKLVKMTLLNNGVHSYDELSIDALRNFSKVKDISDPIFKRMIEMKKTLINETFEFYESKKDNFGVLKDYSRLNNDLKQLNDLENKERIFEKTM